jgi:ribosomal protein S20
MAITSSAKKAFRGAKKKRVFNLRRKSEIESQIKDFRRLIASKNKAEASKLIPLLYKALDKAAKTNYIKANTASRLKSRAMLALSKIAK